MTCSREADADADGEAEADGDAEAEPEADGDAEGEAEADGEAALLLLPPHPVKLKEAAKAKAMIPNQDFFIIITLQLWI